MTNRYQTQPEQGTKNGRLFPPTTAENRRHAETIPKPPPKPILDNNV